MRADRRLMMAGSAATLLSACAQMPSPNSVAATSQGRRVEPFRANRQNLMKVTVCTRPFRPAGPRLETERFGEKTVVHNYGHGGSGWSLSWGCADEASALARSQGHREFAVIGAGVIGMTSAIRLAETGAKVTIYANEFPAETRSARATGVWSPSSRIALGDRVASGFEDRWERWARASHARHLSLVGLDDVPIEYLTQYILRGGSHDGTPSSRDFLHLDRRLGRINPAWSDTDPELDPFPGKARRKGAMMTFNIASYSDRLVRQLRALGGQMVRRAFPDRAAVLGLTEPVIVNCMGYGAKAIWGADDLVPVRGQISWLLPQPGARYGLYYDGVSVFSRRDGVIVQYVGQNEDWGYGDASETADPEETEMALATVRRAYE